MTDQKIAYPFAIKCRVRQITGEWSKDVRLLVGISPSSPTGYVVIIADATGHMNTFRSGDVKIIVDGEL